VVRRREPAEIFLACRATPDAPFLDLLRIFPATAYACAKNTPYARLYGDFFPKNKAPRRERSGANPFVYFLYHIFRKNQSLTALRYSNSAIAAVIVTKNG
jgi:hypothetical protein